MPLLVAIETSSDPFQTVLGNESGVLFDSRCSAELFTSRDLALAFSTGLKYIGASANDVTAIALDIGPGGLSYVRSGVSFANGLAFSLRLPIYAFSSFEIIGTEARRRTSLPVLCGFTAASDLAYVGLVDNAGVGAFRFGPLSSVVGEISKHLSAIAVAGKIRNRISDLLLPGLAITDLGIERPSARVLLEMGVPAMQNCGRSVSLATPLNEEAAIFYA